MLAATSLAACSVPRLRESALCAVCMGTEQSQYADVDVGGKCASHEMNTALDVASPS